jgi:carboxyl-terminal processing protease
MSLKTRGILVLVIGSILGLSLSLGGGIIADRSAADPTELTWEQARLIAEVMERVKEDYVETIDEGALLESAIRGMVSDLDPHSRFLDASEYEDIRASASGGYSGVGIEVSSEEGKILVVAPIDGTPAFRAGIRSGDNIVAIDDSSVFRDGLQETIKKMRGRAGTRVNVSILRGREAELLVFNLRRERIQVSSVRHEKLSPSLGYVRISQFSDNTATELNSAIEDLMETFAATGDSLGGLILDLRNNPGGVLGAAVDVSDLFLSSGIIVTADGRTPDARFSREATSGDVLDGMPMVVLVNKGSASASEIVAGALQDHRRALIVGTSTFGKGLVQTVMPLSKGRAIKLTTSRYFTPSGDSIHETGIEPDILVDNAGDHPGYSLGTSLDREGDPQLIEAIALLGDNRIMQSRAP